MGVLDNEGLAHFWGKVKDALSGKQDTITAGDGVSQVGSTISVTTPVRGVVTQAEFDALPEERRNKGLYVIPGGGGGSGAGEVYSTEETRIGTWIDGKPLYRKIYTGSVVTKPNHAPVEKIVPDWFLGKKLVRMYGNTYMDTGAYGVYVLPLGQHIDGDKKAWGTFTYQKDDELRIAAYWNIALTQELEIVTEYTKNEEGAG